MKTPGTVDEYLNNNEAWRPVLEKLREIMLSTGLKETIKWGAPVYTLNNKNVVGLGAFKSYAGLWFYQGALLSDPKNLLINAQEGVTKALRQMRFSALDEVNEKTIRAYTEEAISNQKAGREIKPVRKKEFEIPAELQDALDQDDDLRKHYESFSHSHRREYAEYISEAKRPDTRQRRLQKIIPMIRGKQGLNDRYK